MASNLPISRVLTSKKICTPGPIQDYELFEKIQFAAIMKAISSLECPVKGKHVRTAIIGTFQEKGGSTFWSIVKKSLPLQTNSIVAWKFCYVLHKMCRDGHPRFLRDAENYRGFLRTLKESWDHMKDDYGILVVHYFNLLDRKLDFHSKNPAFPGSLHLTDNELMQIAEDNADNYFEISAEMFDYMDEILNLQTAVFESLDQSRANSMTNAGQCRISPLIPCIIDSSHLYDYLVKILFKLHANIERDTLYGHRKRFQMEFSILQKFYLTCNNLQYFKNLIQVPLLPKSPPNFLIASDLSLHVSPIVQLPVESEEGILIDTSSTEENIHNKNGISTATEQSSVQVEFLQNEVTCLHSKLENLEKILHTTVSEKSNLELQLEEKNNRIQKVEQEILLNAQSNAFMAEMEEKVNNSERKMQVAEEKFAKLKEAYQQLREEHINLLRLKADVDKQIIQIGNELEQAKVIEKQMNNVRLEIESHKSEATKLKLEKEVLAESLTSAKEKEAQLECLKQEILNMQLKLHGEEEKFNKENQQLIIDLKIKEEQLLKNENNIHNLEKKINDLQHVNCISEKHQHEIQMMFEQVIDNIKKICQDLLEKQKEDRIWSIEHTYFFAKEAFNVFQELKNAVHSTSYVSELVKSSIAIMQLHSCCTIASQNVLDEQKGEKILLNSKQIIEKFIALISLTIPEDEKNHISSLIEEMNSFVTFLENLEKTSCKEIQIEISLEEELLAMDKAIISAAQHIEEILENSREKNSGLKLEVNEKILVSCTSLIAAIRHLVKCAKDLQNEIVGEGKKVAEIQKFYKRNHQWTEGLISAAKAVGLGAKLLVETADKVSVGNAKLSELMVASQEIAASTAQLVVSSKVKADPNSTKLQLLTKASRDVSEATGSVVATAKSCMQLIEENSEDTDFSKLSIHQAKTLEMESQVRLLELECALNSERMRLGQLRKLHYQLAEEKSEV